MGDQPTAAVVPSGERAELQKTAQQTGERFGSMDTQLAEHDKHLAKINGSIGDLATAMAQQATSSAVLAASVKNIEAAVGTGDAAEQRKQAHSTQWWLAIFAAGVAVVLAVVSAFIAVVAIIVTVLIANGSFG